MHSGSLREPANTWTHLAGLILAILGTLILLRQSGSLWGKRISLMIYSASLIGCYAASTLYHGVDLPTDRLGPFIRMDSAGIFALIAGTYTPIAWTLMRGGWRSWTLGLIWATAIGSMILIASGRRFTPVAGTCVYLGMGWGVVLCYSRIARVVTHRQLFPVVLGGVLYSVGAVLNLLDRPILWPGVFGAHALFHLFVIGGSLAHFAFILRVVVPFGRRLPA